MAKAMDHKRGNVEGYNKAGRPAGSGTTTQRRRDRIRAAARERDRLAAEGDQDAMALKAEKMAKKEKSIAEQEEKKRKYEEEEKKKKAGDSQPVPEQPCQKAAASKKEFGPSAAQEEAEKAQGTKSKTLAKGTAKDTDDKALPKSKGGKKDKKPLAKGKGNTKEEKPLPKGTGNHQEEKTLTKGKEAISEEEAKKDKPSYKDKLLAKETNTQEEKPLTKGTQQWKPKQATPSPMSPHSADWGRSSSEEPSSTSSSSSSSPAPPPQKKGKNEEPVQPTLEMRNNKKIAVDWHGVLVTGYGKHVTYNHYNNWWLDQLVSNGYEVHLLSFCGWKRSQLVKEWAWQEWSGWASVSFTWERTGPQGKSKWCLDNGITKIIDDNLEINRECQNDGIRVYPVLDQTLKRNSGKWKVKSWYADFATAVPEILKEDELP